MRIVAILIGLAAILGHRGSPLRSPETIVVDADGNPWRMTWIEASKAVLEFPFRKTPDGYFYVTLTSIPLGNFEPTPEGSTDAASLNELYEDECRRGSASPAGQDSSQYR